MRIDFILNKNKRGPVYWKINPSHVLDIKYKTQLKELLKKKQGIRTQKDNLPSWTMGNSETYKDFWNKKLATKKAK